jgi:hypothetical protein
VSRPRIAVRVPLVALERIDEIAAEERVTRSEAARRLLIIGLNGRERLAL